MRSNRTWPRGLTLLEVLLAMALVVVLLGAVQLFYAVSLRTCAEGQGLSRDARLARAALDRIAEDVRNASGFARGYGPGLVGDAHWISLQSVRLPDKALLEERGIQEEPLPAECDIASVQYYVATDEDQIVTLEDGTEVPLVYGLVRWEQKTLNQPVMMMDRDEQQVDVGVWAEQIHYLGFRYFDGVDWVTTWTGGPGNSLPQAVKIMVGFDPVTEDELAAEEEREKAEMLGETVEEPPLPAGRYAMVVRLRQADTFLGSRLIRAQHVLGNLQSR
jgi:prepilin-type N-terminal cleavage/methylation domain-containing protein